MTWCLSHLYQTSPSSVSKLLQFEQGRKNKMGGVKERVRGSGGQTFRWTWYFSHSLNGAWFSPFFSSVLLQVQPQRSKCASVNLYQGLNVIQQLSLESWTLRSQALISRAKRSKWTWLDYFYILYSCPSKTDLILSLSYKTGQMRTRAHKCRSDRLKPLNKRSKGQKGISHSFSNIANGGFSKISCDLDIWQ